MAAGFATKAAVLNSWKEIAAYMRLGVRTVQRWEHDSALPVHRPKGKDHSAVIAFPDELQAWLHHTPVRTLEQASADARSITKASRHLQTTAPLRQEVRTELDKLLSAVQRIASSVQQTKPISPRR